jgi:hypothetical protein
MIDPDLSALADLPTGVVHTERRAFVRYPRDAGAFAHPAAFTGAGGWWADLVDLSAGGLRLLVYQRFEPGELLEVSLYGTRRTFGVTVCVTRAEPRLGGCWVVGAEFTRGPLTEAELQALL